MHEILQAPEDKALNTRDSWFYLHVVFEHLYKFRFFYNNLSDILQHDTVLKKRFKRLLSKKYQTVSAVLSLLAEHGVINIQGEEVDELSENITLLLTHWITHTSFRGIPDNEALVMHRGIFQIMSMVSPFLNDEYRYIYREFRVLYQQVLTDVK